MKKIFLISMILLCFSCFSCINSEVKPEIISPDSKRIKLIHQTCTSGRCYYIIEADKHFYLFGSDGGVVHMESCPCKNIKL